jgi:hypothetical protein
MTRGFRRTPQGIVAVFDVVQAGVLRRLAGDLTSLMQPAAAESDPDGIDLDGIDPVTGEGVAAPASSSPASSAPAPGDMSPDPLEALFADFAEGPSAPPEDPVLARLLPDAYAEQGAASDFRRFTENDLRAGKAANARALRETLPVDGGEIRLDDEQAAAWLGALNDLRLTLGTALEVGPDTEREYLSLDPLSGRARRIYLYFWLGVLQETLIEALTQL